jgi:Ca-activated chloride channel homolog
MSFDWPLALVSLVVAPALLLAYWLLLRRRRKQAVRYSSVALLRTVRLECRRW